MEGRLNSQEHGDLVEAFEESLLPIKVDLDGLSSAFRERIERDFVVAQNSGAGRSAVVG